MEKTQNSRKNCVLSEPFPHFTVENMYNEEELELIWEELNFLTKPHKFAKEGYPDTDTARNADGSPMSQSKMIHLDNTYTDRSTSNILNLNRKLFEKECLIEFSKTSLMSKSILYQNQDLD